MRRLVVLLVGVMAAVACGSDTAPSVTPTSVTASSGPTTVTPASVTPTTVTPTTARPPGVAELSVEVVSTIPHDTASFTQGLVRIDDGFYESTGLRGQSSVQELAADGSAVRRTDLDPTLFGEGLELVGDQLIQLTFEAGTALVYDTTTLDEVGQFGYEGEGWGLCQLDDGLVMSNGTDALTLREVSTFAAVATVDVTLDGAPLDQLNELECVAGTVWANVWKQDIIVGIDPDTGEVHSVVDASGLFRSDDPESVLNGIAYDAETETFWITGKNWPTLYEVRFVDSAG
ncbi:MAG: glutaminyl-peptide cyclotransferase [Acidimicrobiales bacterium]